MQAILEGKRAIQPRRIEPQRGVVNIGFGCEARDNLFRIGPARHKFRRDKRSHLNMPQPGCRKRINQRDLVSTWDRVFFDLKAFARAFLGDIHLVRQIGHGLLPSLPTLYRSITR